MHPTDLSRFCPEQIPPSMIVRKIDIEGNLNVYGINLHLLLAKTDN